MNQAPIPENPENHPIIIKQNNVITEARYSMSALEKNIVYMLLTKIQENDPPEKKYFISISEMQAKLRTLGQIVSKEDFEDATQKLVGRVYSIEDDLGYLQMGLLASVVYTNGSDLIEIEISSDIKPYFFHIKNNFSEFELDIVLGLRSFFSKRIYEILNRYKEIGTLNISVEKLKSILDLINPATKKEKFQEWSAFESNVLITSQEEIEKYTDISFTYILRKTSRKYTDIEFKINQK